VHVYHFQELEPAAIGRGVELVVHGPHLVRMLRSVTAHLANGWLCPLSLPGSRPLQAFLPAPPLHTFVFHVPALAAQEPVGQEPTQVDVFSCDLPEAMAELCLLHVDELAGMALGAAVLPHHPVDKSFRSPVIFLQDRDGSATSLRAQKFPLARSLSIAFPSSASARSFFRLAFSYST